MRSRRYRWPVLLTVLLCAAGPAAADEPVAFNRDVRPILAARCFRCHGPDEGTLEADLRLDDRARAVAELESGETAIVPGEPDKSELIARIDSTDDDLRMPPADAGAPLKPAERELLRRWIAEGATYERHWAYVPPERPEPPANVRHPESVRRPLDRFVLARLDREGLAPAPPADRYALARRLSLDLTGLPPTIDQVDRFVADTDPRAYENYVDRLLDSPAYGERWARVWLDLARYADSAGYAQDPPRTIWMYRDWVIRALNANQTFDQFTIEQLAGDMLPDPTPDQLIATAFHRNTMTNSEGGTDDEEFRSAAVVDRVNTTMQVWMGLTMGCAQCHTHKYDPITHQEYFRFYAVFNQTADADRGDESPTLVHLTPQQEAQRAELQSRIAGLEAEAAKVAGAEPPAAPASGPLQPRYVRIEHPGKQKLLSLAEVQLFAGDRNVALQGTATQSSVAYEGPPELATDGNTDGHYFNAKSTTHTDHQDDPWWEVDLGSPQTIERIEIWNRTDNGLHTRLANFDVVLLDAERRPVWVRRVERSPNPSVRLGVPADFAALDKPARSALAGYLARSDGAASGPRKEIELLKKKLSGIKGVPTPILRELPAAQTRKTHIHIRGSFLDKGDEVTAGVPAALHPLLEGAAANRLEIARWLVDRRNPLTARVVVNRYWEQLFGTGLVETSEDFGVQGQLPSHPRLLDYLAVELMEGGWDVKELLRELVGSATYRQSSRVTPELAARDPQNRLLARGPRFRLSAEMIRDQALAASGLLSRKMYGPSVQPPRPALGLKAAFGGSTDWKTSGGEDRYRRGLYTSWRRTTPYPSMTTFDAPSREVCTVRRIRTNTPLQALVTLNDPVFIEAAQALARRVVAEGGDDDAARATYAFRLCLARLPTAAERERIVALLTETRDRYAAHPGAARAMASEPLGPPPAGADLTELAAWTVVANVLLNLDECLAKR